MNRRLLLFPLLMGAVFCPLAQAAAPTCRVFNWSSPAPIVRAEGVTELVSDVYMVCTGGTPVGAGAAIPSYDIRLSFNANVTSRILGIDGVSSEALLLLDEPAASPAPGAQFPGDQPSGVCPGFGNGAGLGASYYGASANRNVFQGLVGPAKELVWKSIPFDPPGTGQVRTFRFTNIRLDATSLASGIADLKALHVTLTGPATIPVTSNSPDGSSVVGTAQTSLIATVRDAANGGDSAGALPVPVDSAASLARVATLRFAGAFAGADKPRTATPYVDADTSPKPVSQNDPGVVLGAESGFYNSKSGVYGVGGNLGTAGLADAGTRYMTVINNIPDGFDVFVDIYNSTSDAGPTARLIGTDASGAGAFLPAALSPDGKAQLTVS